MPKPVTVNVPLAVLPQSIALTAPREEFVLFTLIAPRKLFGGGGIGGTIEAPSCAEADEEARESNTSSIAAAAGAARRRGRMASGDDRRASERREKKKMRVVILRPRPRDSWLESLLLLSFFLSVSSPYSRERESENLEVLDKHKAKN